MDTRAVTLALISHFGSEVALSEQMKVGQSSINRWASGGGVRGGNLLKLINLARRIPSIAPLVADVVAGRDEPGFKPQLVPGRDLVGGKDFPVFSAAMGGDGHIIVTFDPIDFVKRPTVVEHVPDAYGLYVVGESMEPAFESGDMALVNPRLPPARDRNHVFYHIAPDGGESEAIVKRLLSYNDKDWLLAQYNPAREFTEPRADWPICHRIVGRYESR